MGKKIIIKLGRKGAVGCFLTLDAIENAKQKMGRTGIEAKFQNLVST